MNWLPPEVLAKDQVGKYLVSTVRIPKREYESSLWETLIFGGDTEDYLRFRSEEEAKKSHEIIVWALKQVLGGES